MSTAATEKKTMATLARANTVMVVEMNIAEDFMLIKVPVGGIIAPKTDKDGKLKETHVVVTDTFSVPRSDGKMIKLQINGWYK
jgi:hypothetical protein